MRLIRGNQLAFQPAAHENPDDPGVWKKVLAAAGDLIAGRIQMINWAKMRPGARFVAHYHEDMQEVFILMRGRVEIVVAGKQADLEVGDAIIVEPREAHAMHNPGDAEAEFLAIGIAGGEHGRTVLVE